MPYETLIETLLEEGRSKSEAVVRNAQAEADRLLVEAKQTLETMDRELEARITRDIAALRTAILSRASLSARRVLLQARHEVLEALWREAKKRALTLTGDARKQTVRALLEELLAAVPAKPVQAVIDGRERSCLEALLAPTGIPFEEQRRDDLLLGISLRVNGQVLTSSFTTRLAKAKPELILELNRLLFKEGEG